jgi:DNA (cytosine-5)-methyltransferase 1
MSARFIDLFAGIGGFHAAGKSLGMTCVFSSEIDEAASKVYSINWGKLPSGDIHEYTRGRNKKPIPEHDVLFGGFPCQPFSKSGKQLGMKEDRGSLFHDILFILKKHKPSMVVLENVRNISGPRHEHEWNFIVDSLRSAGYRVSRKPFVVSPHRIPPSFGGTPQARERVFIVGSWVPPKMRKSIDFEVDLEFPTDFESWDPSMWNLFSDLPLNDVRKSEFMKYRLSSDEIELLNAWDKLVGKFKQINDGARLPGFPLWSDIWGKKPIYVYDKNSPKWKKDFENKNRNFYLEHKQIIDNWLVENPIIRESSPSKRKLEWQAQDMNSLWEGLLHFRPSGIRVKKPNYVPALVAITQTTIIGKFKRRITPSEGAMLQGLEDNFDFGNQSDQASYKQLGNGVAVGAVYQVVKALAKRDEQILKITNPKILKKIMLAPNSHRLYQVQNTRKVANVSVQQ